MTASETNTEQAQRWVLQFCHGYDGPFLDCARQYAVLFKDMPYKVCTVYLTGAPSAEVERGSASDEVIFLDYSSAQVRGLKLGAIRDLRRIAASRDFALCIAHRFKPIYVALLGSELPVIGVHHAFGDYERRSRKLFANCFRKRLRLLGVSNAVRDDIRACLPSWPVERIETLYNRIDIAAVQAEQVSREQAREHLGLPQDAWVVGNVGRLHPDKDQATLIRGFAQALPQLPDGSLLAIMGRGRLEAQLKALAAELGISDAVRFLGQVANGRRYFKAFDVFALTSDHEPFGMVLLEAMAAGIAILASDCGGAPEVVGDSGALFPLKDTQSLAQCLKEQSARATESSSSRQLECFSDAQGRMRFLSIVRQEGWLGESTGLL
ncbi:glycosyltransferase [Pseudomonas sp. SH1-B]